MGVWAGTASEQDEVCSGTSAIPSGDAEAGELPLIQGHIRLKSGTVSKNHVGDWRRISPHRERDS